MGLDVMCWYEREKLVEVEHLGKRDPEGWLMLAGGERLRPGDSEWFPETWAHFNPPMGEPERERPAGWRPTPGTLRYKDDEGVEREVQFRWLDASRGCDQFVFHLLDGTKLARPNVSVPKSEHPVHRAMTGERLLKIGFLRRRDMIRFRKELDGSGLR